MSLGHCCNIDVCLMTIPIEKLKPVMMVPFITSGRNDRKWMDEMTQYFLHFVVNSSSYFY